MSKELNDNNSSILELEKRTEDLQDDLSIHKKNSKLLYVRQLQVDKLQEINKN